MRSGIATGRWPGSLISVFAEIFPDAEIMLYGVEELKCLIHAPNESVDPAEIEHFALAQALFLKL